MNKAKITIDLGGESHTGKELESFISKLKELTICGKVLQDVLPICGYSVHEPGVQLIININIKQSRKKRWFNNGVSGWMKL